MIKRMSPTEKCSVYMKTKFGFGLHVLFMHVRPKQTKSGSFQPIVGRIVDHQAMVEDK